jgi:hypothetical protein
MQVVAGILSDAPALPGVSLMRDRFAGAIKGRSVSTSSCQSLEIGLCALRLGYSAFGPGACARGFVVL